MSVKIRLKRTGRHKDAHCRVVAVDSRKKSDGKMLEYLGHYHPQEEFPNAVIHMDKVDEWVNKGAQVTDTVKSLISKLKRNVVKEEK